MDREQFKKEFLTDAFFFVKSREEFETLQKVGLEFGLKNPNGDESIIHYDLHDISTTLAPEPGVKVAKNLTFFPCGKFQKSGFWVSGASYGDPKFFDDFINAYNSLG